MKQTKFSGLFLLTFLFVAIIINNLKAQQPFVKLQKDDCKPPTDFAATTPHVPSWYSIDLNWSVPIGSETVQIDSGTVITNPGQAANGGDASTALHNATVNGISFAYEKRHSVADDFTLLHTTRIDSIKIYTMQMLSTEASPRHNVKEVYIRIYDRAPDLPDAKIIWGDFTTSCISSVLGRDVRWEKLYRTPEDDLTYVYNPVLSTYAKINATLPAGTYWIEVSATSRLPDASPHNGQIAFLPVTTGKLQTGNALYKTASSGGWIPCVDNSNNARVGFPFIIYGKISDAKYNVYRDDVKLNPEPLINLSYNDAISAAGNYVYGVTSVIDGTCESQQTTTTVRIDTDPCEFSTKVTDFYKESFENAFPSCWSEITDAQNKHWQISLGTEAEPATAKLGTYKAMFKDSARAKTKLITCKLDISTLSNPELSFWHAQKVLNGKQDGLTVYYKNAASGLWMLLKTIAEDTPGWANEVISLPDPSATYWIAFEAEGNGGNGVMLDEVSVRKQGTVDCYRPKSLTTALHTPDWYNVDLSWHPPVGSSPLGSIELFDNGPLVTHPKAGYGGSDVSAAEGNASAGGCITRLLGYSIADDFTITEPMYIDRIDFFTFDKEGSIDLVSNVNALYVCIYKGDPREGGKVIWGDLAINRLNTEASVFSNIYRAPQTDLTNNTIPIMRTVADIDDITLEPGTYWIEITCDSKKDPRTGVAICTPPVTVLGEVTTGNAIEKSVSNPNWSDWVDPGTGGQGALPFEIYGKRLPVKYDVYRDGTKLTPSGVADTTYKDTVPGAGTYVYVVEAVWDGGCISDTITKTVVMPADPCETAISQFPYLEDFETSRDQKPACWITEKGEHGSHWEFVTGVSTPTTSHSGDYKAFVISYNQEPSKLITPMLDITDLEMPALNFWHTQSKDPVSGEQCELRIYYKNSPEGEWKKIAEYTDDVPEWTERTVFLPEKSATYWIAFEGAGSPNGYVNNACLDDIGVKNDPSVAVEELKSAVLKVYPNPTTGDLKIDSGKKEVKRVEIYNLIGKKVYETTHPRFNIGHLPPGVYLVKVNNLVTKIIKQ